MTAYATPVITHQFFDDAGDPVAAGKVYTYSSGTTTPKTTYTDQAGVVPNANPIILDAAGKCSLWLGSGEYTIRLETSAGALVRSEDHVSGVATASDISGKLDSSTAASTYALKNNTVLTGTLSVAGAATFASTVSVAADAASANEVTRLSQVAGFTLPKFSNLLITATGTNSSLSISADQALLQGSGIAYKASAISLSLSLASSGANGLDVGAVAASTFYFIHLIYNPTTVTLAVLASLSATAPTLPTGYTSKCLIGCTFTDATANKYPFKGRQFNSDFSFAVGGNVSGYTRIATGVLGAVGDVGTATAPTWSAVTISSLVPSIASHAHLLLVSSGGQAAMAAPSASYGAYNSETNPPPMVLAIGGTSRAASTHKMLLESLSSVQYASNGANCGLYLTGWTLNL